MTYPYRYWDANTYTDYPTKKQAVRTMIRQNGGQVWKGPVLIAWLTWSDETFVHVVDLRTGKAGIEVLQ